MHSTTQPLFESRLLVVDDNPESRAATLLALETRGYTCDGAATGEEALEMVDRRPGAYSVCILDQELQPRTGYRGVGLTGMDTLVQMKRRFPKLQVIVFTAHDDDKGREALKRGASSYVKKAFDFHHLASIIDVFIKVWELEETIAITADERDRFRRFLDAVGMEVTVVDPDCNILLMNDARRRNIGLNEDVVNKKCDEVFGCKVLPCEFCPANGNTNGTIGPPIERQVRGRWLLVTTVPIRSDDGHVQAWVEAAVDITRRKKALEGQKKLQGGAVESPEDVAQTIVEVVASVGFDRVRLYIVEDGVPKLCAWCGMQPEFNGKGLSLDANDPIALPAWSNGGPTLIGEAELRTDPNFQRLDKEGVTSQLVVPLISGGRKFGMVSIDNKYSGGRPFTTEDVDLVTLLAAAISGTIQNAIAMEEKNRRIAWLDAIRRIDTDLAKAPSPERIARSAADELCKILKAPSQIVLVRNGVDDPLEIVARSGEFSEIPLEPHPGREGVVARCLKTNELQIVNDVWSDPDFQKFVESLPSESGWKKYTQSMKSLFVVPIRCGEAPIGVIILRFTETPRLTQQDREFVADIAGRVAIALAKLDEMQMIEATAVESAKLSDLAVLTAGIAHAVRNPVTEALYAIELAEGEPQSEYARERLTGGRDCLRKALVKLEGLLKWTRPEGNEPNFISVLDVVEELGSLMEQEIEEREIEFQKLVNPETRPVFVPPNGFKMAMLDLLKNALTAMPHGGVLSIRARNSEQNGIVIVEVSDTGHGMTEAKRREVLNHLPFAPSPAGGPGLGLWLANKIVKAAGGHISCESALGQGTRFVIELPSQGGLSHDSA